MCELFGSWLVDSTKNQKSKIHTTQSKINKMKIQNEVYLYIICFELTCTLKGLRDSSSPIANILRWTVTKMLISRSPSGCSVAP